MACTADEPDPQPISADEAAPDGDQVTEPDDPATEDVGDGPEAAVIDTWIAFHQVWTDQLATGDTDPAAFEGLAEDPDQWAGLLDALDADDRWVTLEVEHWTVVDIDGDQASIGDCIIAHEHLAPQDPDDAEHRSTWWTATAIRDGDDWLIRSRNEDRSGPCVARELNDQLLAAYEAWRDARRDAWDPPDPEHPAIAATMVGGYREFFEGLVTEFAADGVRVEDPASTENAVVFRLEIGLGVVSDCFEQHPDHGAFDIETGERLDDLIPPIEPGQVDLISVELTPLEDGWKVQQQGGLADSNCEPGATDHVVR